MACLRRPPKKPPQPFTTLFQEELCQFGQEDAVLMGCKLRVARLNASTL